MTSARSRDMWIAGCLLLLILGVYVPVRHFDFINLDDPVYVTQNPHVTGGLTWNNLRWAFTSATGAFWIPLTWISLMLDCQMFGAGAGTLHSMNVAIHAVNTLLLFGLLKRITHATFPSAAVAFLFALHPQHVESVAWVTERKDVLSALFWMLALWSYASYAKRPRPGAYLLTVLLYCLGFLAKPMAITLPVVLLLLDIWPLKRASTVRALLWEKLPFFVLAVAMSAVTFAVQNQGGATRSFDAVPLGLRLGNAVTSIATYIGKTIWPSGLAVFYPMQAVPAWRVIALSVGLLTITVLVLLAVRTRPYLAVGWFWYLVTLLPVIGIVQVGDQARADRFTYIPLIGLSIMVAWSVADAWDRWPGARPAWTALCVAAVVACLVLTSRQVSYWENSMTLFEHANQVTVRNPIAHGCLGDALRSEGRYGEALAEYRMALAIQPGYVPALINYGAVLGSLGRTGEALVPLASAVKLRHDDVTARSAYGLALAIEGHLNEAREQFEAAVSLKPDSAAARISLGNTLGNLGRIDDAIAQFSEALRLEPQSAEARAGLQRALALRDRARKK